MLSTSNFSLNKTVAEHSLLYDLKLRKLLINPLKPGIKLFSACLRRFTLNSCKYFFAISESIVSDLRKTEKLTQFSWMGSKLLVNLEIKFLTASNLLTSPTANLNSILVLILTFSFVWQFKIILFVFSSFFDFRTLISLRKFS